MEILDLLICEHRIKEQIQLFVDKLVSSSVYKRSSRFSNIRHFGFNYLATFASIAMGEFARGILSKDIVLFAVKVSHSSVELKRFGLLMENGTNPYCVKLFSSEV